MPYDGEYAHYRPLRRLYESARVKELLGSFRVRAKSEEPETEAAALIECPDPQWMPDWVIAVDGSHAEVPVQNGYPGAEASYITVASVLLPLAQT